MKGTPVASPSPLTTETRARAMRLGRMSFFVPSDRYSTSSCCKETNSASIAMSVPFRGRSSGLSISCLIMLDFLCLCGWSSRKQRSAHDCKYYRVAIRSLLRDRVVRSQNAPVRWDLENTIVYEIVGVCPLIVEDGRNLHVMRNSCLDARIVYTGKESSNLPSTSRRSSTPPPR